MCSRALVAFLLLTGAVGIVLGGCGEEDLPDGVAAEVHGRSVSEAAIDHAVVGRIAIKNSAGSLPPYWPADIKGCIQAKTDGRASVPSLEQAKARCQQDHARHRVAALRFLIQGGWYQLEARKRGLRLPPVAKGVRAASRHAGVQAADMRDVVRAFEASEFLMLEDPPPIPTFTQAEIARYYERHRDRYAPPPFRLIRALIMPTRHEARAVLVQMERRQKWDLIVRRFGRQAARPSPTGYVSTNTIRDARLLRTVDKLGRGGASIVKVGGGWYVFRVMRVVSSKQQQSLMQVSGSVEYDLRTRYQRRMRNRFNARLRETYRADTVCSKRYHLIECK